MKKWCVVFIGLIFTIAAVGCKSKKEMVYEQQIEALRKIFIANGLNAEDELKYGIGVNVITEEISRLDLSSRNLTKLPPEIGLFTGLEELDLRINHLTELPDEIGNLVKLKKLNLAINKLIKLPESIGDLTALEDLDISENRITELPSCIGNLVNLNRFMLFINKLTDLPMSMANLTRINHIAPMNNDFKTFPKVLGMMSGGTTIMMTPGFDTTTIPPNVIHETGGEYYVSHSH